MSDSWKKLFINLPRKATAAAKEMESDTRGILVGQIRDAIQLINQGVDPMQVDDYLVDIWEKQFADLRTKWAVPFGVDAYKMVGSFLGRKQYSDYNIRAKADFLQKFTADELLGKHIKGEMADWIARTSAQESKTSARKIERLWVKAQKDGLDVKGFANLLKEKGVADTEARANLIADTTSQWAYNRGAAKMLQDSGYTTGVWFTNHDSDVCEFCEAMDGKEFSLGGTIMDSGSFIETDGGFFDINDDLEHPPLHPHCRCTIIPKGNAAKPPKEEKEVKPKEPKKEKVPKKAVEKIPEPVPPPAIEVAPEPKPEPVPIVPLTEAQPIQSVEHPVDRYENAVPQEHKDFFESGYNVVDVLENIQDSEKLFVQGTVQRIEHLWGQHSNGHPELQRIHEAVSKEFNVPITKYQQEIFDINVKKGEFERMSEMLDTKKTGAEIADVYARNQYRYTQDKYKEAGISELTVYRGVSREYARELAVAADGGTVEADLVNQNVLSSWSADPTVAAQFAMSAGDAFDRYNDDPGVVIEMKIPASRVFASAATGIGVPDEAEVVVIASRSDPVKIHDKKIFLEYGKVKKPKKKLKFCIDEDLANVEWLHIKAGTYKKPKEKR